MALSDSVLANLIATEMKNSDPTITEPAMVDKFAQAIAKAIVQHITTAGVVTIPPAAIQTSGSAASQVGPPAPVPLQIT